jgi:DNA-binding NarL/FixJ family response regulator
VPRTTILLADDNSGILSHVGTMIEKEKDYKVIAAISDGGNCSPQFPAAETRCHHPRHFYRGNERDRCCAAVARVQAIQDGHRNIYDRGHHCPTLFCPTEDSVVRVPLAISANSGSVMENRENPESKQTKTLGNVRMPGLSIFRRPLTRNPDPEVAAEAFTRGASGYLLKTCATAEMVQAVREVLRSKTYLCKALSRDTIDSLRWQHKKLAQENERLTERQREVLQLLAEGKMMKEVGDILNMTPRTVAFHKYRMMEILGRQELRRTVQVRHQEPHGGSLSCLSLQVRLLP